MVKEKKYLYSAIIVFMIATLMMLLMTSCKKGDTPKVKEKEEIAQVSVESIKYDGETLTWNSVLHADSYEIKANNEVTTTTEAKWEKVIAEDVTFEIRGLVDETNDSYKSCSTPTSKSFEYKGQIKVNREGRTLNWEAVADARGYQIMENGTLYHGYQSETSYDLVAVEHEDGTLTSTFKVKAEFEDEKFFTIWSDELSFQILAKPTNVKYDGKVITWDSVKGADLYELRIKRTDLQGNESNEKVENLTDTKYVYKVHGDDDGSGNFEAIQSGTFSFDVVAKAKDKPNVLDSDVERFSLSYVEPIENIYMVDGVVTWDAIPNADYYILKVNGKELENKVYTNRYDGITESCTVSVMPQREDGTIYSNWSANASLTYVKTPYLNWVYDADNTAYYLDWQTLEDGSAYPKDGKTFTIIVYEVYGDDIHSLEYVSSEGNRTSINNTAVLTYAQLQDLAAFTQGKKYAVRVIATSGDQEITTASSQLSNPVFFYFVTDPSAYTQSAPEMHNDKLTTTVMFNDVQIPDAFKGFELNVLYRCRISNTTAYEVEGGELAATTTRTITIHDAADALEHEYTLAIQTTSADDKKMLEDTEGNKCVFMFSVDPTITNEKTYKLTRLATPNVTLTGSTLTWDSISQASGYMVKIVPQGASDSEAKIVPTSSRAYTLSELEAGKYNVYVAARGNGNIVLSSKYSNVFQIRKLPTPTNVHVEKLTDNDKYLTWDPIEGCNSYQYTLGTSVAEVDYNQTGSISQNMLSIAGVNFSVIAIGNGEDGNGYHLISSNSSEIIMLYKLATPKNIILDNDVVRWDEVNAIGGSTVGYNVYNGEGNLMNSNPLETAMFNLYDYAEIKERYDLYNLNVLVETVVLDESKTNYWPSDYSTFYTVQRLASPTNVHMNQYTGEITWDQYSGANPDYVAGYSIKIVYKNHPEATESYYVTTNSFPPDFKYFEDETVEITVRAVGNMVNTISSNPYNVTTEGQKNKIGCVAKLEKLATLENLDSVTYDVDEENHIKVCIDGTEKIKGNGYGISIGGVNNVVRTYNESENIYQLLAGTVYEYTLANGSKAQYDTATNKYTYISRYSSAGTYEIKVRVEGGNYSQDPNTVSEKTICYVTSEYTAQSEKVIILGQFAQNELKFITDKTNKKMIQFNNMVNAQSYEYTIQYTRAGGIPVGEAINGTLEVTSTFSTIDLTIPEGANSIVITIRALGDNVTVFDSIRTTTTEIIISNTK